MNGAVVTLPRICVVGATGFIGRNLIAGLTPLGAPIRAIVRPGSAARFIGQERVESRICELTSVDALAEAISGSEVLYHLASGSIPSTSNDDPQRDVEVNLLGTLNLLEACKMAGVKRVIFVSSGGTVYGRLKHCPVPEEHPTFPICSYGIVKLAIERYLHLYRELHGLEYTILRASNPYGPFQSTSGLQGAVPAFIAKMLQGKPIEVWGDGSVVRDFLFVDDLIRALIQGARMPSGVSGIYNVGSGIGTSLNELLSTLVRVSGLSDTRQYQPGRAYDVPTSVLDISRIKAELHWAPQTSLEEGLRRTLDWLKHDNATTGGSIALSNPKNIAP